MPAALAILNISGDVAITVLGAVSVAVFTGLLTAFTTNKRLDKQLAHEREIKELEVAHDRELKDVEELRSLLDDAAVLLADAMKIAAAAKVGARAEGSEALNRLGETMNALVENGIQVAHMEQRIGLRLGLHNDVTRIYVGARRAQRDFVEYITKRQVPVGQKEQEEADRKTQAITAYQYRFLAASRQYIRSQIGEK